MKWFWNLLGGVATSAILFAYIAGTIHSCNKHPDDSKAERFTPYAVYRGIEMFWHNDFPGVDWKQKISEDVSISIQLLSAVTQPATMVEANQQLEHLANQLESYPASKRKEVANAVRMCLRYGDIWAFELWSYLTSADSSVSFSFSADANSLMDSLRSKYNIYEIDAMRTMADSVILQTKDKPEERILLAGRLKDHVDEDKLTYKRYFPKLFNEDF
jgi:hypothetical protein